MLVGIRAPEGWTPGPVLTQTFCAFCNKVLSLLAPDSQSAPPWGHPQLGLLAQTLSSPVPELISTTEARQVAVPRWSRHKCLVFIL